MAYRALILLLAIFAPGCLTPEAADAPATQADGQTLLVVAREWFWVNSTSGQLRAHVGPHCEDAAYRTSPPWLEVALPEGASAPAGVLLRDFDDGSLRSPRILREGAGLRREDLAEGVQRPVRSPFDEARTLFAVELDGDDVLVDGARLAPGETRALRAAYAVERDGTRHQVHQVVELRSYGLLAAATRPLGLCD